MILTLHIAIALAGIMAATYAAVSPKNTSIKLSCGLLISTLVTGAILVVNTGSSLLKACATGLLYVAFTASLTLFAQKRLTKTKIR